MTITIHNLLLQQDYIPKHILENSNDIEDDIWDIDTIELID